MSTTTATVLATASALYAADQSFLPAADRIPWEDLDARAVYRWAYIARKCPVRAPDDSPPLLAQAWRLYYGVGDGLTTIAYYAWTWLLAHAGNKYLDQIGLAMGPGLGRREGEDASTYRARLRRAAENDARRST